MPFDFKAYKTKCNNLSTEELQLEWQNYTRQITSGATLTAASILMSPLSNGISLVGLVVSVPQLHNARKKRSIVMNKMHTFGTEPRTRKRDVATAAAIVVATAGLSLGLSPPFAELLGAEAGVHGVEYLISHTTLDAIWFILDEAQMNYHHKRSKRKLKQKQLKQKQYLANVSKSGEYPQIGLDVKSPRYVDGRPRSVRDSLRPYYLEEDNRFYHEQESPPPLYSKKYIYQGGLAVQSTCTSRSSSRPPSVRKRTSQIMDRGRNCSSSSLASEKFDSSRSTAASRRLSASEEFRPRMLRPVNPNSVSKTEKFSNLKYQDIHDDESDLDRGDRGSGSEEENESSDEESDDDDDDDDDDNCNNEKSKDHKVIEQVLTLEQEIIVLKATILRMEMEKRGLASDSKLDISLPVTDHKRFAAEGDQRTIPKVVHTAKDEVLSESTKQSDEKTESIESQVSLTTITKNRPPLSRRITSQESRLQDSSGSIITSSQQPCDSDSPLSRPQNPVRPLRKRHDSGYSAVSQNSFSRSSSNSSTPNVAVNDVDIFDLMSKENFTKNKSRITPPDEIDSRSATKFSDGALSQYLQHLSDFRRALPLDDLPKVSSRVTVAPRSWRAPV